MEQIKNDKRKTILLCLLSAGLAGVVFMVISIIRGISPFGDNLIIRNDAITQYVPFLIEYINNIKEHSLSLWSWSLGGGMNQYGFIAYYLLSPFNLLALPFNASNIDIAFWLIIIVKTMCIGLTACYYFQRKSYEDRNLLCVAFALIYTFSGFYIAYYYNTMWLDALIMLPLIALGIENIVNGKKATMYFLSLAYAIFVNFYLGYMICIFAVIYFFYLLFSKDVTRKAEEKKDEAPIMSVMAKFGFASLFAGLICAVVIVPIIYALGNSSSVSNFDLSSTLLNFFDFLSYHLSSVTLGGVETAEQTGPYLMSSMLTFLTVPVFFCLKNVKLNKKIASIVVLVIFFFSFSVARIFLFWHGFTAPHGLPYRFSFLYLFFIISLAFETVKNIKEVPLWSFGISAILITVGLVYTKYSQFAVHFNTKTIIISSVFTVIYFVLLVLLKRGNKTGKVIMTAVSIVLAVEIVFSNYSAFYYLAKSVDDLYYTDREIEEVLNSIKTEDSNTVSRFEIFDNVYDLASLPAIYQYNGLSTFSSMADNQFAISQMTLGDYGNYGNAYKYVIQTPIYNSLFSVDYVYDLVGAIDEENPYYEKVQDYSKGTLFKAKYTLPFGCCIDESIDKWDPYSFVAMSVQSFLWKYTTGVDGAFDFSVPEDVEYINSEPLDSSAIEQYIDEDPDESYYEEEHDHDHEHEHDEAEQTNIENSINYNLNSQSLAEILNTISKVYPFRVTDNDCRIEFSFTAENEGEYYARISTGSMQTLEVVTADGVQRVLSIENRHMSDLGYFKAGEEFKLVIKDPDREYEDYDTERALSDSVQISVASINEEKFLEGYNKILENGVLDVDTFEDTYIHGTVNSTIDGYMMMPMPYDLGWTVYVDGEQVEPHEHESHIMMFEITKGEHEIEMSYFPQGLKEGIFVSVAAVLGLALVLLLGRVHKMKLAYEAEEAAKAADTEGVTDSGEEKENKEE